MALSPIGDLAIAFLVLYVLLLPFSVLVCMRHGFGRSLGWFYLIVVPVARITGAACQLAADQKPSTGLIVATLILNSIGFVPLVLVLLGILERLYTSSRTPHPQAARLFRLAHILALVCLILGVIAGTKSTSTTDASALSTARSLRKAAAVLLLVLVLALAAATLLAWSSRETYHASAAHASDERRLLLGATAALPFLLVRVVDLLLAAFSSSVLFRGLHQNVFVMAFMVYLMEWTAAVIFVVAGLTTQSSKAGGRAEAFEMKQGAPDQQHQPGARV